MENQATPNPELPDPRTDYLAWQKAMRNAKTAEELTELVMQLPAPEPGSPAHRDSWPEMQGFSMLTETINC